MPVRLKTSLKLVALVRNYRLAL